MYTVKLLRWPLSWIITPLIPDHKTSPTQKTWCINNLSQVTILSFLTSLLCPDPKGLVLPYFQVFMYTVNSHMWKQYVDSC